MNACHCDACKKLSGGTNLLIITAPREAFEHLSGEVQRYPPHRRFRPPDRCGALRHLRHAAVA